MKQRLDTLESFMVEEHARWDSGKKKKKNAAGSNWKPKVRISIHMLNVVMGLKLCRRANSPSLIYPVHVLPLKRHVRCSTSVSPYFWSRIPPSVVLSPLTRHTSSLQVRRSARRSPVHFYRLSDSSVISEPASSSQRRSLLSHRCCSISAPSPLCTVSLLRHGSRRFGSTLLECLPPHESSTKLKLS